eukprot:2520850-Prymnesium_polylepis.1
MRPGGALPIPAADGAGVCDAGAGVVDPGGDRRHRGAAARCERHHWGHGAHDGLPGPRRDGVDRPRRLPVSYTHLTLPTICSV